MLPLFVAATPSYFTEFALYCTAMHGVLVAVFLLNNVVLSKLIHQLAHEIYKRPHLG